MSIKQVRLSSQPREQLIRGIGDVAVHGFIKIWCGCRPAASGGAGKTLPVESFMVLDHPLGIRVKRPAPSAIS